MVTSGACNPMRTRCVCCSELESKIPYRGYFSGVQIFVKSCRGSSELIFVVLNFVTPKARYAITD